MTITLSMDHKFYADYVVRAFSLPRTVVGNMDEHAGHWVAPEIEEVQDETAILWPFLNEDDAERVAKLAHTKLETGKWYRGA